MLKKLYRFFSRLADMPHEEREQAQAWIRSGPEGCVAHVELPADAGWTPPFDKAQCSAWPERWDQLTAGSRS